MTHFVQSKLRIHISQSWLTIDKMPKLKTTYFGVFVPMQKLNSVGLDTFDSKTNETI